MESADPFFELFKNNPNSQTSNFWNFELLKRFELFKNQKSENIDLFGNAEVPKLRTFGPPIYQTIEVLFFGTSSSFKHFETCQNF